MDIFTVARWIIIVALFPVLTVGCQNEPDVSSQEFVEKDIVVTSEDPSTMANADVIFVRAVLNDDETWTFHVTVQHPDIGWDDYADGWDILTPDGLVLKPNLEEQFTRTLLHPHVDEQPFERSQGGIVIPDGVTEVHVRAHDIVDGFGGKEIIVDLSVDSGPGFEVQLRN